MKKAVLIFRTVTVIGLLIAGSAAIYASPMQEVSQPQPIPQRPGPEMQQQRPENQCQCPEMQRHRPKFQHPRSEAQRQKQEFRHTRPEAQRQRQEFQRPQMDTQRFRNNQPSYNYQFPNFSGMQNNFWHGNNPPDINLYAANWLEYGQFGLSYNREKRGYFFDDKLVGLFIDRQNRRTTYLSREGQVHIKAVRGDDGNLTALVELSSDEYNEITAEIESFRAEMRQRMQNFREEMSSPRSRW